MDMLRYESVAVGPFLVADISADAVVDTVIDSALEESRDRPWLAFALHVGGLNSRRDVEFVRAMALADLVYADGGSVVSLARLAGAKAIERAPTTDVGWRVLAALSRRLDRPVRVALIGGPPGLAERAADAMAQSGWATPVGIENGYQVDWAGVLARLGEGRPDLLIVGMGAPREMLWCAEWKAHLPSCVVLTCGGWFGHVAGEERRAPRLLRRSGLEWIARVAQSPGRLGPRYLVGIGATAHLACEVLMRRAPWRSRRTG